MTCAFIGRANSIPLIEADAVCRVAIPDSTGALSYVDGVPVFSLGVGIGESPTTANPPEAWTPPEPVCVNLPAWTNPNA